MSVFYFFLELCSAYPEGKQGTRHYNHLSDCQILVQVHFFYLFFCVDSRFIMLKTVYKKESRNTVFQA